MPLTTMPQHHRVIAPADHLLRSVRLSWRVAALVALGATLALPARAATIEWVGDAQSIAYPVIVSGNGAAIAFTSPANTLMHWTAGTGALPLGGTGLTYGMTYDGSLHVGQANGSPPGYFFAFVAGGGSIGALPLDSPTSTHGQWATGISDNGLRICGNEFIGSSTAQACEWDYTTPASPPDTPQGYLFGGPAYAANGVSRDGSVIVGFSSIAETQGAVVWNRTASHMPTGRHDLANLPGGDPLDVAHAASGNGSLVIGSRSSGSLETGFYWTWAGGSVDLPTLPDFGVRPTALDAAGDRIVGTGITGTLPMFNRALLWSGVAAVPRLLSEVAELDYSLPLGGAILLSATSISADGTTIAGLGYRPGHPNWEAYRLVLSAPTAVADGEPGARARPSLTVAPNPAFGAAWAEFRIDGSGPATLELLDVTGRIQQARVVPPTSGADQRERLELTGLPAGAYWVRLRQGGRSALAPIRVVR